MPRPKMKAYKQIKDLYKPMQPSVKAKDSSICYQELKPDEKLSDFIYCFWQLKTKMPLNNSFSYRVVSDGCIDIFFNLENPKESFVMGFSKQFTEFSIGTAFNYIGIRFLPSFFPLVFNVNAKQLSNQAKELHFVLPKIAASIEKMIFPNHDFKTVTKDLNALFTPIVAHANLNFDSRFYKALILIFNTAGHLETETDLNTVLSPRQLRRIFNFYIGTTPKAFSKVIRFQQVLNANPSTQSLKENKFYYEAGFFDQAHFIKDFKTFYGVTPMQAFR